MHTFDLAPFPSFLHSGKATNRRPCSRLLLRTVFDQIKTSFLMPKNGLKICPFLLFGMPSICISIAHLLWFCLGKQKWMQSQHVGNSRNESLNNTPILEKELVRGNTVPNGFQSINSMWSIGSERPLGAVNQPQSSTAPTPSHRGLSEPSPAPQAELEAPHAQWFG